MEYKTKQIDGYEVSYSADWINELESEVHFTWYYNQAKMIYQNCKRTDRILEIGLGTGLLSDMLKRRGWNIQTLDIDNEKMPDFCDDALTFDYKKANKEIIVAFEVFEHIPFQTLEKILENISNSGVHKILFSVPWNERRVFTLGASWRSGRTFKLRFTIPGARINTQTHFWELAKKEKSINGKHLITVSKLKLLFESYGYELKRTNKIDYIQYFSATAQ